MRTSWNRSFCSRPSLVGNTIQMIACFLQSFQRAEAKWYLRPHALTHTRQSVRWIYREMTHRWPATTFQDTQLNIPKFQLHTGRKCTLNTCAEHVTGELMLLLSAVSVLSKHQVKPVRARNVFPPVKRCFYVGCTLSSPTPLWRPQNLFNRVTRTATMFGLSGMCKITP